MKLADGGRPNGLLMWLGHYQVYFLVVAAAVYAVVVMLGSPLVPLAVLCVLVAAWLLAAVAHSAVHRRRLCERCIRGAPVLDPQGAVDRWRAALRYEHKPLVGGGLCVLMLLVVFAGPAAHLPGFLVNVAVAVMILVYGWGSYASYQHHRLQPWCPWCPRNDGGNEESMEPVPETPLALR